MSKHHCQRVICVRVNLGEFSGVEPELMKTAFGELVNETPVQGAVLELSTVPLEARCNYCGKQFLIQKFRFECPACVSQQIEVVRGEDLLLESVEMEESDHEKTRANGRLA